MAQVIETSLEGEKGNNKLYIMRAAARGGCSACCGRTVVWYLAPGADTRFETGRRWEQQCLQEMMRPAVGALLAAGLVLFAAQ